MAARLDVSRSQILAYRQQAGNLDRRLQPGKGSLRNAAWAGLQDSSPYAALHSIHARVEETQPETWEDPTLVQLWGPRYTTYVVAAVDVAVFSLGRQPDDAKQRQAAHDLADRLSELLEGQELTYSEAGGALDVHPNRLRYAATTGRALIRWHGSGQPTIRTVQPPDIEPSDARLELARRYLHVFGPATSDGFAKWAGMALRTSRDTFERLNGSLTPVHTPIGHASILSRDEPALRSPGQPTTHARLLPSGDPFFLLWDANRELLVSDATQRNALWPSRVWPGAVLVDGEIVGTWRRAKHRLDIETWRRLSQRDQDAVEAEASALPILGMNRQLTLNWHT